MKYPLLVLLIQQLIAVSAYDSGAARTALYFSKVAYCDVSSINAWSCLPCRNGAINGAQSTQVFTNSGNGGQAFVTYHPATS